jgi:hypothetical protein
LTSNLTQALNTAQVAKELGLQIGKSDAPQLAVEKAAAGKGKGGKGKKAKEATTTAAPPPQQAQHDPIKVPRWQPVSDACRFRAKADRSLDTAPAQVVWLLDCAPLLHATGAGHNVAAVSRKQGR